MTEQTYSHRSSQKLNNKPFKSKHASKGSLKALNKGKVNRNSQSKSLPDQLKSNKKNRAKLIQQQKRQLIQTNARLFSGLHATPKSVAIIPLCPDVDSHVTVQQLFNAQEDTCVLNHGVAILTNESHKQRIAFMPLKRNLMDCLDALKVADLVIYLLSAKEEVDAFGEKIMSAIKAQGVPNVICMVQHLSEFNDKKKQEIRKSLMYYMNHHFAQDQKLFSVESTQECVNCIRHISSQMPSGIVWRERYPYITAQSSEFVPNEDGEFGTFKVTGYIRGNNMSANRLVHIPEFGDFQVNRILDATESKRGADVAMENVLHEANPELRESLVDQNDVDPMEGEQTWPTEEELAEADERVKNMEHLEDEAPFGETSMKRKVPVGTSSYQAAWILDDDENGEEVSDDDEQMQPEDDSDMDNGDSEGEQEEIDVDTRSVKFDGLDDEENALQLKDYLKRVEEERDHLQFPDEVDTPQYISAAERFARYRGLKSFRTSPWDPYENLPVDYSRIFQFKNFKRSKKRAIDSLDDEGGVAPGTRVTIEIDRVPASIQDRPEDSILSVFGLMPYEHKISIVNFSLKRTSEFQEPVKSKDPMILMIGFRRYIVQPIYSTFTRGGPNNVHKFERYLTHGKTSMASIYAPIQFGPAPILLFKYTPNAKWTEDSAPPLVAYGSLLDPQPLRIIAKRIVLTGHPFKIHKRGAVIRFMFHSPKDVDYFKPIQLHTKFGRTGHIKESLGTHGYMKCQFDAGIKQHDTVCMNLYKRLFPKWTTRIYNSNNIEVEDEEMEE
ncbi:hypothetical protein BC833DRAFT_618364 [Globomyces pollinis-pini]|nr:hypothetical protein BC833DRAFT_618364 [Globomyces pollinis-pini]